MAEGRVEMIDILYTVIQGLVQVAEQWKERPPKQHASSTGG